MSDSFEQAKANYASKANGLGEEERLNSSHSSGRLTSEHNREAFESARRFLHDEDGYEDDDPDEEQDTFADQKIMFNRPSTAGSGSGLGSMKDDWDTGSIIRGEDDAYANVDLNSAYGKRRHSSGPHSVGNASLQAQNNPNPIVSSIGGYFLSCWQGLAFACSNVGDHIIDIWVGYTRRQKLIVLGLLAAIVIAIVAIAVSTTGGGSSQSSDQARPHPTLPPGTGVPHHPLVPSDPERYEDIRRYILDANLTSVNDLDDHSSYQNKALRWVVENDIAHVRPESLGMLQRYALATLFFGTYVAAADYESRHPPQAAVAAATEEEEMIQWKSSDNWMTDKGVCEWYGVGCVDNIYDLEESSDNNMNIVHLDLRSNNVEGYIPSELKALNRLRTLKLGGNSLFGTIPESLGDLEDLITLNLHDNRFSGGLPESLGRCLELHELDLGNNELNGSVPSSFEALKLLRILNLGVNMLSGQMPTMEGKSHIEILQLDDNDFKGTIPSEYGDMSTLTQLNLRNNKLHGSIPSEVGLLSNLKIFTIGFNQLTSTIPPTIETMSSLTDFEIPHNKISGPLPEEFFFLEDLEIIRVEGNRMTGTIPGAIGTLEHLHSFHFFKNNFTGHVPDNLCDKGGTGKPKHLVGDCLPGGGITCNCCNRCYR